MDFLQNLTGNLGFPAGEVLLCLRQEIICLADSQSCVLGNILLSQFFLNEHLTI